MILFMSAKIEREQSKTDIAGIQADRPRIIELENEAVSLLENQDSKTSLLSKFFQFNDIMIDLLGEIDSPDKSDNSKRLSKIFHVKKGKHKDWKVSFGVGNSSTWVQIRTGDIIQKISYSQKREALIKKKKLPAKDKSLHVKYANLSHKSDFSFVSFVTGETSRLNPNQTIYEDLSLEQLLSICTRVYHMYDPAWRDKPKPSLYPANYP